MSRQREFQQRLALYHELQDIMGAMKNMAQAELHKLRRRQQQQQRCIDAVAAAANDVMEAQDTRNAPPPVRAVYLVIGSERGFCGGFNEALTRYLKTSAVVANTPLILVGSRLVSLLGADASQAKTVMGATSEKQISVTLTGILDHFQQLLQKERSPLRLVAVFHALHDIEQVDLFPLNAAHPDGINPARHFQHHVPLPLLKQEMENHFLYHSLLGILYTSLYVENYRRLTQMEGALQHLDELSQQMKVRINSQRQEEIVEEIEVIFSNVPQFGDPREGADF